MIFLWEVGMGGWRTAVSIWNGVKVRVSYHIAPCKSTCSSQSSTRRQTRAHITTDAVLDSRPLKFDFNRIRAAKYIAPSFPHRVSAMLSEIISSVFHCENTNIMHVIASDAFRVAIHTASIILTRQLNTLSLRA